MFYQKILHCYHLLSLGYDTGRYGLLHIEEWFRQVGYNRVVPNIGRFQTWARNLDEEGTLKDMMYVCMVNKLCVWMCVEGHCCVCA